LSAGEIEALSEASKNVVTDLHGRKKVADGYTHVALSFPDNSKVRCAKTIFLTMLHDSMLHDDEPNPS
jgi:hypothetical protein